jgi:hypothetical protein
VTFPDSVVAFANLIGFGAAESVTFLSFGFWAAATSGSSAAALNPASSPTIVRCLELGFLAGRRS